MIAAVSPDLSAPADAAPEPTHWLQGRYFVPLPDLSDETRQAIYAGRAAAAWMELVTRLKALERRGPDDLTRRAAVTGRIEGLGVNGLAAALGCSHTTALKHLRHLEQIGLIRTEQGTFTNEVDEATGRIKRNYAKAPPKVIIVTIEDRHCRPCRSPRTAKGDTPGTGPKATGGTPETGGKSPNPQARNWRVSKDGNLQRGSHPLDGNRRRTAAGPHGRPAAAAAKAEKGQRPPKPAAPPETAWQRQTADEKRARDRQRMAEFISCGLGMPFLEVIALWQTNGEELKSRCVAAGIMTPEGKLIRPQRLLGARHCFAQPRQADPPPADDAAQQRFRSVSERIWELRDQADAATEQAAIEQAREAAMKLLRDYAKAEGLSTERAVA